jgi:hypothetical protein
MKTLLIVIAFVASAFSLLAQSTNNCDFLKNLKFENGRDTIVVKAVLLDYLQAPPRLIKKKRPKIYRYRFGSNILFQPENCARKYQEPALSAISDKENLLNGNNLGATVYLTCVVFNESLLNNGELDCLAICVSRKKPINFK